MIKKSNFFIFLTFLLPTTVFLVLSSDCKADSNLIINEIQLSGGTGKSTNEFLELYNPSAKDIDLSDFRMEKKTKTGTKIVLVAPVDFKGKIPSDSYFLIAHPDFDDPILPDLIYSKLPSGSFPSISENNSILLYDKNGILLDKVGLGSSSDFEEKAAPNPGNNKSIERNNFIDSNNNFNDFEISLKATPQNSTYVKEEDEDNDDGKDKDFISKIKINEIYPYPDTKIGEKEFIEIINTSDESTLLPKCHIEDAKNHKSSYFEIDLEPKEMTFFEDEFSLNNNEDTASLYCDGFKNPLDTKDYKDGQKYYSYAFDGSTWQWTSKVTKGTKNEFDKILSGKIKKDKNIYSNVYADFEVKADSDAKKFTWNFGDGHKSYLKKTRHKYEKSGTYQASLKITGNGKSNVQNFEVEVENFGKSKVRITSLSANPKGIDSKNEWIEISNNTKKKVNLEGWGIATGWRKLYNHPIREDFILKPGKTKRLTRDICAFTLANKQTKIELRYPDGKIADKLKYEYGEGSIGEDDLYAKNDKKWQWLDMQSDTKENQLGTAQPDSSSHETDTKTENLDNNMEKVDIEISPEELEASLGQFSEDPSWQSKKENRIILLSYNSNIKTPSCLLENHGKVLGVEIERTEQKEVHWLKNIIAVFLRRLNLFINTFF